MRNFTFYFKKFILPLLCVCAVVADVNGQTYCTPSSNYGADIGYSSFQGISTTGGLQNISISTPNYYVYDNNGNQVQYGSASYCYASQNISSHPRLIVSPGATVHFILTESQYAVYSNLWIDYNQNGIFTDANETVFSNVYVAYGSSNQTVTIPSNLPIGTYRMRLSSQESYYHNSHTMTPCGVPSYSAGYWMDYDLVVVPPCVTPTAQPVNIAFNVVPGTISGTVIPAASGSGDSYLIVRTLGTTPVGSTPVDGTTYPVGSSFGAGTVVSSGNNLTFSDVGLQSSSLYTYTVFTENAVCSGSSPLYCTAPPLVKTVSSAYSGIVAVPLSGFNDDMIANGTFPVALTVSTATTGFDGNNNWNFYTSADYSYNGNAASPGMGLPANGVITSSQTPGLTWQLANYTGNNCLWLPNSGNANGTLTFATPTATSALYVLASSGSAGTATALNYQVNFSDGTNTTGQFSVQDWTYTNNTNALTGLASCKSTDNSVQASGNHVMNQFLISLSGSNATKPITSITFTNSNNSGFCGIWAISLLSPCTQPTGQPSNFAYTTTVNSINGSFTSTPTASAYLVIRTPANTPFNGAGLLTNGTAYLPGTTIGNGMVIYSGPGTSFSDASVLSQTTYTYTIFAANSGVCTGGPLFNIVNPLVVQATSAFNGYTPVPVTGYNYDWIANGTGPAANSVSPGNGFDNSSNDYVAADFNYNGTSVASGGLPLSGVVGSNVTSGLKWQLADYSGPNCLWLPKVTSGANSSGTLNLVNPQATNTVYVLACTGSGNSGGNVGAQVNFIDGTSQSFTFVSTDWTTTNSSTNAVTGLASVKSTTNVLGGTSHLFNQYALNIAPANAIKPIASITFTNSGNNGYVGIWAISTLAGCQPLNVQATNLNLTAAQSSVSGTFTASTPAASGYVVIRTSGSAPLSTPPANYTTYAVGAQVGNGVVVAVGTGTTISDFNLSASASYTYYVYSYTTNTICAGPIYNTLNPLTKTVTTTPANTYTWNQTVSGSYTTASNWTPARNNTDPSDILVFNNGNDTVTNVPSQIIARISVNNNTTVHLRATTAATLTLNSDGLSNTNELDIASGSSVISDGTTAALTLAFLNNINGPANVNIAGTLEVSNLSASIANILNFTNSVDTVRSTGTLAAGGINVNAAITGMVNTSVLPNTNNITVLGTYNHKYTTIGGPLIPTANWATGSNLLFSGYTSATTPPALGMGQTFYNVIYNCPQQSVNMNWGGTGPLTCTGTFTMASTGTGALQFAGNTAYNYSINNYVQTGGTLDLSSTSSTLAQTLNVSGNFNQTGGIFMATNPNVSSAVTVNFNGTTTRQQVNFSTSPSGPITYRVSGFYGINTTCTPPLSAAPVWIINNGGGIRISSSSSSPITSTAGSGTTGNVAINYTTGTTLTYDTLANLTATSIVWPSATPPYNVTINVGIGNAVTVPFSATIGGTLTFQSGDINMTSNTLTIGTSAVSAGAIVPSTNINAPGNIRITSGGLTRWINPSLVPTSASTSGLGYFPVSVGLSERYLYLYFSNTSAVSTGGTVTVKHNGYNTTGTQTCSVADASPAFTITSQTKASWTLTNSGLTLASGATIGLRITGADMFNPLNVANLRLMHLSSVAGNYVPGSGSVPNVSAERTGLALSDLSTAFYIGGDGTSMQGIFTAITTGNWTDGTKWDRGSAPTLNDIAVINPGVTTTINATTCAARSLTINGTLTASSGNTLTIDSALMNNGTVNMTTGTLLVSTVASHNSSTNGIFNNGVFTVNGGTLQLGPANGSNKQFLNSAALSVLSGNMTVNGNLSLAANSVFVQNGGNIYVDGNAGGVAAASVGAGTPIVSFATSALTMLGGTLTIVDPHADGTTNTPTFQYGGSLPFTDSNAHTFAFGNGTSVDTGGSARGFLVETNSGAGRFNFGTLVINGGFGINRRVTPVHPYGVNGNMIINNNGEYYTNSVPLYVNGNLIVNTGGILTANALISFSNYSTTLGVPVPSVNTQSFISTGLLRDAPVATPAANISSLSIMNNAPVNPGVSINTSANLIFSGNLSFTPTNNIPTHAYMAPGFSMVEASTATVSNYGPANGWVVGTYQKHAAIGALSQFYPVGDSLNFSPVLITGPSNAVTATGDISVKVKPMIDPNFATSHLNPLAAVKRYFTIDTLNGVRFTPATVSAVLSWVPSDVIGTLTSVHVGFDSTANSSGGWVQPFMPLGSSSATSVQVTGLGDIGKFEGDYQPADTCPNTNITLQPQVTSACINGAAVFNVNATGAGLTYAWYNTATGGTIYGTSPLLNISPVSAANAGDYFVVINSACAKPDTSAHASLLIGGAPVITTQPLSQTICVSNPDTVRFIVNDNTLGTQFTWYHNYSNIPIAAGPHVGGGTVYLLSSPGTNFQSDTLMIVNPTINDSGVYSCVLSIGCNADTTYPAVLTVNVSPVANITAAGPISFCTGGSVQLDATTQPGNSYQWFNPSAAGAGSTITATTSGTYYAVVTNANGCTDTSNTIIVDANALPSPNIVSNGNTAFCMGDSVTLSTTAVSGYIYEWLYNSVTFAGPSFTLSSVPATQGGIYQVKVSTPNGCIGISAPLTINEVVAPSVAVSASGPTNICDGTSVNLIATTGSGLTYQWQNNGVNISGQTGYTFAASAFGNYDVVVSNGACSVTSSDIAVTVTPSPAVQITAAGSTTFCQGSSVTLQASSGNGWNYQWDLNGITIPGATDSAYVALDGGTYTVMATNSNNCTTTSPAVSLLVNPQPMPVVSVNGNVLSTVSIYQSYQWYLDSHPIPNATTNTYTVMQNGKYSVFVIDANGCGNMSAIDSISNVGVGNITNSNDVKIYPNPAKSIVHIDAPYKVNVSISGLDGKVLLEQNGATQMDISHLANGVYIIRVSDQNGALISIEKLIKTDMQ